MNEVINLHQSESAKHNVLKHSTKCRQMWSALRASLTHGELLEGKHVSFSMNTTNQWAMSVAILVCMGPMVIRL